MTKDLQSDWLAFRSACDAAGNLVAGSRLTQLTLGMGFVFLAGVFGVLATSLFIGAGFLSLALAISLRK